jgi:hypothetical protein
MFGQALFRRTSDEWLVGRTARVLFGIAAAIILLMTPVWLGWATPRQAGLLSTIFWSLAGASAALAIFFLWGGMWTCWMRCDPSGRVARRMYFLLLLGGIWYGPILYYLLVYLRKVPRQRPLLQRPLLTTPSLPMKVFARILAVLWIMLAAATGCLFAFPQAAAGRLEGWILTAAVAALLIATATYKLLRLYHAGMRRPQGNLFPHS